MNKNPTIFWHVSILREFADMWMQNKLHAGNHELTHYVFSFNEYIIDKFGQHIFRNRIDEEGLFRAFKLQLGWFLNEWPFSVQKGSSFYWVRMVIASAQALLLRNDYGIELSLVTADWRSETSKFWGTSLKF